MSPSLKGKNDRLDEGARNTRAKDRYSRHDGRLTTKEIG